MKVFKKDVVNVMFISLLFILISLFSVAQINAYEPNPSQGIKGNVVTVGAFTPETGPVPFYRMLTTGAIAYFNWVNDHGGVGGYKFNYITRDDGYQPSRTVAVTKQLVENDNIFSLVAAVGTTTNAAVLPYLSELGIPNVGVIGADPRFYKQRNFFMLLPDYRWEAQLCVQYAVKQLGIKQIGVLFENDELGRSGLKGAVAFLKNVGLEPVEKIAFDVTEIDFSSYAAKLEKAQAKAVILWGSNRNLVSFKKAASRIGYDPAVFSPFFVATPTTFKLGGDLINGSFFSSWLLPMDSPDKNVVQFREAMAKYFPKENLELFHLNGWSQASVFGRGVEIVTSKGKKLTWQNLINALDTIKNEKIGGAGSVTFSPGDHGGTKRECLIKAVDGKFVAATEFMPLPNFPTD